MVDNMKREKEMKKVDKLEQEEVKPTLSDC